MFLHQFPIRRNGSQVLNVKPLPSFPPTIFEGFVSENTSNTAVQLDAQSILLMSIYMYGTSKCCRSLTHCRACMLQVRAHLERRPMRLLLTICTVKGKGHTPASHLATYSGRARPCLCKVAGRVDRMDKGRDSCEATKRYLEGVLARLDANCWMQPCCY